ncbi:MAG: hypothetical protein ABGZ35_09760, partial [Planctomycetaceae bacterium]
MDAAFEQKPSSVGAWAIGTVVVMLLCGIGLGVFFLKDKFADGDRPNERSHEDTHVPVTAGNENNEEPPSEKAIADPVSVNVGSPEKETSPENEMEVATAEPPSKPKSVDPFEGKQPFDNIRKKLQEISNVWIWEVPAATSSKESFGLDLFLSSATSLSIECGTAGISITPHDSNSTNREWQVSFDKTVLGRFEFRSHESPQPASLHWSWDDAIRSDTNILSNAAKAVRVFRNSRITFRFSTHQDAAVNKNDELTIVLREDSWTPFTRFAPTALDNRKSPLGVRDYDPRKSPSEQKSETLYIESDELDELEMFVVDGFNKVIPGVNATLVKSPIDADSPGQKTITWKLGLALEGTDDAQEFGEYVATKVKDDSLVKLHFQWKENSDTADCRKVSWAPIRLDLKGHSVILFPREPDRKVPIDLKDLAQSSRFEIAIEGDRPLVISDDVPVHVVASLIERSGRIERTFSVVRYRADGEKRNRNGADFFFALRKPFKLSLAPTRYNDGVLGGCRIRVDAPELSETNVGV